MTYLNYYKVLGIQQNATEADIRRAYRTLARRYHPDVNPGSESAEKFKAIAEAYRVLSNTTHRSEHDEILRGRAETKKPRGYKAYTEEMRKHFQAQSEQMQKAREKRQHTRTSHDTTPDAAEDSQSSLLHHLRRASQVARAQLRRFSPVERNKHQEQEATSSDSKAAYARSLLVVEAHVSVEEAINGTKKKVEIPQEGKRPLKISLQVPPGVHSGSTVRMRSPKLQGQEILCIVHLLSHPYLLLTEQGLEVELPVSIAEAYFGSTIEAPTLNEPVKVAIPAKSSNGERITLRGQGPKMRDGQPSDLIFRLAIQEISGDISVEQQQLLRELSETRELSPRAHLPRTLFDRHKSQKETGSDQTATSAE